MKAAAGRMLFGLAGRFKKQILHFPEKTVIFNVASLKEYPFMKKSPRGFLMIGLLLLAILVVGQAASYVLAPASWSAFVARLPVILSMVAFWGPIVAIIAGLFVWAMLRMLGFSSLEEIRQESLEQNNPTPAIIFVGTLIASLLFLLMVIRP
jgi:hypothetical protein